MLSKFKKSPMIIKFLTRLWWIRERFIICELSAIVLYYSFRIIWRTHFGKLSRTFSTTMMRKGSKIILKHLRARVEVICEQHIELKENIAYIFMVNHQSLIDLPIIVQTFPFHIRFLVKKEIFKYFLFGKSLYLAEHISIDRENPENIIRSYELARQKLKEGIRLCLFPEGTRSRDGKLCPLKMGGIRLAREMQAFIIPVGINGTQRILPAKTSRFALDQLVTVRVGKPIDTTQYSVTQQVNLANEVSQQLKKLSRNPETWESD